MAAESRRPASAALRRGAWALVLGSSFLLFATPSFPLSEIKREELPPPAGAAPAGESAAEEPAVPAPAPIQPPPAAAGETAPDGDAEPAIAPEGPEAVEPDGIEAGDDNPARPMLDPDAPVPEIIYDLERLPKPARRMRELILEACNSGDIERLRPLIGSGESATLLSLGGVDGDVIAFLKQASGDGEGHETLAILAEVLEAGFVHMDAGEENELFVWPYFFAVPLEKLTAPQKVELFRIVTAGDYEDMKSYGAYVFYRVGITPEGRWSFFVAGD
jgi:hypothetical protein